MSIEDDAAVGGDNQALRDLAAELQDSWNRHDMKSFSLTFTEDAEFVNVAGMRWKGRREIELRHAERHKTQFGESRMDMSGVEIRIVAPGVAILHGETRIQGDKNQDGTPRAPRATVFTGVAVLQSNQWKLAAFQNTNKA